MFVFTIVNLFPRCLDNALMSVDAKEVAFFIQSYNSEFEEKKICAFNTALHVVSMIDMIIRLKSYVSNYLQK